MPREWTVFCAKCGLPLKEPGGLLFSPPDTRNAIAAVAKFHLCVKCYKKISKKISG
jgi:hypothetical protein